MLASRIITPFESVGVVRTEMSGSREKSLLGCIEGSLALSHKKNPRILRSKTAGFFHKNQLARSFAIGAAEAPKFFILAF